MNILANLIEEARHNLAVHEGNLRIDNIIIGKTLYTMKGCGKVFTDMNFCLVLLENSYGFSYFQEEIDYSLGRFVNKNALDVVAEAIPIYMKVAITDAMYCLINGKEFINMPTFSGDIRQKAKERARILLAHIPKGSRVLLLGAATEIIEEAIARSCDLKVVDLEQQKIGLEFQSALIEGNNEKDLKDRIKEADYVVATGMIFVSETADDIFRLTIGNGKKLVIYMETGSNFGQQLIGCGADIVLSEFFPFYDFFGETKYMLFKK
ncbi:hypothetical protein EPO05_02590 [Patescibacteria group bacterium]|nr:MAG: hypothetical protein EPO05_02590 [Patescibacteria group bacterium]